MKTYTDLEVFKTAHSFAIKIFELINNELNKKFRYILGEQLLRATISIPANIAEGYGRYSKKEKIRFLYICRGSIEETKYYLLLLKDVKMISEQLYKELNNEIEKIAKMLNNLITYIKSSQLKN